MLNKAMETAPIERDLLARVAKRDTAALAALYDVYGGRVYSLAVMVLGETMLAQEVTQDVFLRVWQKPEKYHYEAGHFASWLLTITRNLAIDRLRSEKRKTRGVAVSIDEDDFGDVPDVSQAEELRWRDAQTAFARLPAEQSEVVRLAFYHGLSQSEIAEHLGAPLGTIKTRMRIAMEKLRAVFVERG
jgi:RNA polymerase sigma-70 factor (ECF subfamily)